MQDAALPHRRRSRTGGGQKRRDFWHCSMLASDQVPFTSVSLRSSRPAPLLQPRRCVSGASFTVSATSTETYLNLPALASASWVKNGMICPPGRPGSSRPPVHVESGLVDLHQIADPFGQGKFLECEATGTTVPCVTQHRILFPMPSMSIPR